MTNICKRIPLLFISLLLLSGCGKGKSKSSDTQPQDVKVESISFKLMTDTVYINHYAYIQEFEVLPKSATNKDVKWSLSDIGSNGGICFKNTMFDPSYLGRPFLM